MWFLAPESCWCRTEKGLRCPPPRENLAVSQESPGAGGVQGEVVELDREGLGLILAIAGQRCRDVIKFGVGGGMEVRVLGPTVSPVSPELFLYSCQALARLVLLLDLQARVIYLPPHSGWGQGPGPAGQGKCLAASNSSVPVGLPISHWAHVTSCLQNWGRKRCSPWEGEPGRVLLASAFPSQAPPSGVSGTPFWRARDSMYEGSVEDHLSLLEAIPTSAPLLCRQASQGKLPVPQGTCSPVWAPLWPVFAVPPLSSWAPVLAPVCLSLSCPLIP